MKEISLAKNLNFKYLQGSTSKLCRKITHTTTTTTTG
jgi:hypothetical protein